MEPKTAPNLGKSTKMQLFWVSIAYIISLILIQRLYPNFVCKFTITEGVAFYLSISGIAATLTGFVIAGTTVLSTILTEPEFKFSALKKYFSQIYFVFSGSSVMLGCTILFGIFSAVFPKNLTASLFLFYITCYVFTISIVGILIGVRILGDIVRIDASGILDQMSEKIEFTDRPTSKDG
ncbi:hypothetical protein EHF33_00450 [Deinococcus psychrotolerans]|uniref:Uncharacterized protein n=1 Tax=Deinococcus psychrotolerans TaxID=2489213 RepID=A0A3G8Y7Q5_9DEIO|nr:hypothetical protein [Deinococcus psychrotolerans]AZI41409.1 hypothetical protein EHF33_00450 [Deinococcus psychrotolerans]